MKILIIDVMYKYGSTGMLVYNIHNQLINNHDVIVCYGRGPSKISSNAIKITNFLETLIDVTLTRLTGLVGFFNFFATYKLLKLIENFKPDVIHLHEMHGYYINFWKLIKYIKKSKIPLVITCHSDFAFTGRCGSSLGCHKWTSCCNKCPLLNDYPKSFFFDFSKFMFNKKLEIFQNFNSLIITAPSNWLSSRLKKSFLSNYKIITVNNGIDITNIFYPKEKPRLEFLNNKKLILLIGSNIFDKNKGGSFIFELAKYFKDDSTLIFGIVGSNKSPLVIPDNIYFFGTINDKKYLSELYSYATLTLVLSMQESFSLVCAESLACGTPVIGFKAGAVSEIAPEGYGLFVDYGNVDELALNLRLILDGKIKLNSSDECARFARLNYSKTDMVNNFEKIYFSFFIN